MLNLDGLRPDDEEPYLDPRFQRRFPDAYDHLIRIGRLDDCICGRYDSIYRVMKLDYLIEMIKEREMVLENPNKEWRDPFENPLSKLRTRGSEGGEVSLGKLVEDVYGNCWTTREEADYMWDYYTKEKKKAVIIESTPMRILGNFLENTPIDKESNRDLRFCIGAVEYIDESDFIRKFEDIEMIRGEYMGYKSLSPITSLLTKRKEFEYEKEVRLLYRVSEDDNDFGVKYSGEEEASEVSNNTKMIRVPIKPEELIKSIKVHPEIDDFEEVKHEIRNLGFSGDVELSTLFDSPDLPVRMNSKYPIDYIKRRINMV